MRQEPRATTVSSGSNIFLNLIKSRQPSRYRQISADDSDSLPASHTLMRALARQNGQEWLLSRVTCAPPFIRSFAPSAFVIVVVSDGNETGGTHSLTHRIPRISVTPQNSPAAATLFRRGLSASKTTWAIVDFNAIQSFERRQQLEIPPRWDFTSRHLRAC